MKPIIGIVEYPTHDEDGYLIYEITKSIVNRLSEYGAISIGIFPTQIEDYHNKKISEMKKLTILEKQDLDNVLSICDAIVKPGGSKIYEYERYIYDYVYKNDIPYLGICAGMQMMANYQRSINNEKNNTNIEHYSKEEYIHTLKIIKDTLLYKILGKEEILVNSRHLYHIQSPGIHKVNAYSDDGIIEGIENPNKTFHLGLQWHPEILYDQNTDKIFDAFIESSKKIKKKV